VLQLIRARLRRHPGRAAALMAGILVAATSFTLLTAAVRTSSAITVGIVRGNARSAYDILVRPPGTKTALERSRGLVQGNFLSGIFGGITLAQYHQVAAIPGVDVAAPIANLGYVLVGAELQVSIRPYLDSAPYQAYRLRPAYVVGDGQRVFPDADMYVYVTSAPLNDEGSGDVSQGYRGRHMWVCLWFNEDQDGRQVPLSYWRDPSTPGSAYGPQHVTSPFDPRLRTSLQCVSTQTPGVSYGAPPGLIGFDANVEFPVELTAIDPVQETRLVGLDHALVSGRMLTENEATAPAPAGSYPDLRYLPVLMTSRPYADETLDIQVQRLTPARPGDLPAELGTPGAYRYLTGLPGRPVAALSQPFSAIFRHEYGSVPTTYSALLPGGVTYVPGPDGTLSVRETGRQPADVWDSEMTQAGFNPSVPVENTAPQVRQVTALNIGLGVAEDSYLPRPVGRFDPGRLAGFSALSQVPLETFREPQAVGADPASRAALHDQPLRPDRNLGGYLQQPPAMLTTMNAIPHFFEGRITPPAQMNAPVSAIMIRVKGVTGIDALSRARVNAVATELHRMFPRLDLDVTVGSSPEPETIMLPAGVVTASAVRVTEDWAHIGVAVAIISALDRKSSILFLLILMVCGLFLGHATVAAVRARRTEIGTLRSLGWSRGEVFISVLAEPAAAGLIAGAAGAALAAVLGLVLHLRSPAWYPLLVIPVALVLSILAGALPAWHASRIGPLEAISRPVPRARRARPVRSLPGLAVRDLTRAPGRTALGALALALGVAALTILLAVTFAYRDVVSVSLLGSAVVTQARGVDYLSAVLALILGVAGTIDVLMISLRERAQELAVLRACGWSRAAVSWLTLLEGLGIGLLGGAAGALAGMAVVTSLGNGLPAGAVVSGLSAAAGGALLVMLAAVVPVSRLSRLTAVSVLGDE
jgi:putative ABC transport system permease protein